jgi:cobalt transporter subunit CbtB
MAKATMAATPHEARARAASATQSAALPALFAVLLGLFVVAVTGFSQIDVIHNAAHNTRHANAFPCH